MRDFNLGEELHRLTDAIDSDLRQYQKARRRRRFAHNIKFAAKIAVLLAFMSLPFVWLFLASEDGSVYMPPREMVVSSDGLWMFMLGAYLGSWLIGWATDEES